LDELPQLLNILKGEMSLVGPRPIVHEEIAKYKEAYPLYTKTVPGLTGLWQVSGRNHTTYAERINYDSYYVRNWSFWMDIYLLARTVSVVLTGDGAY
jgi:lipopolysaccharide/colanic/teichoic acid biosynthesis glycosyltransferase